MVRVTGRNATGEVAGVTVDPWWYDHVADPRRVICTRCQAGEGERCKNLTTGKRAKTFHAERLKLERRARALVILKQHGPMTAADFAAQMWYQCDPHTTARNAAGFLRTLWREGLALSDQNPWGTTYRARRP